MKADGGRRKAFGVVPADAEIQGGTAHHAEPAVLILHPSSLVVCRQ